MLYRGRVELVTLPENKLKVLAEIKKKFSLNISISELMKNTEHLPYVIAEVMYDREYNKIVKDSVISDYVKFIDIEDVYFKKSTWWEGLKSGQNMSNEDDDDLEATDPQSVVMLAKMLVDLNGMEGISKELGIASESECKALLDEVTKCVYHTQEYLLEHKEQYNDRGLLEDDSEEEDIGTLWLCGLVDILSEYQYVCELDWKTELEDFIYFVENLKGVKARELPIDEQWFAEDDDIPIWCEVLLEKWGRSDLCFAGIDMESDSYVIFPYDTAKLSALETCAQKAGIQIRLVENM